MSLYSDAIAAYQSSQSGREADARQALAAALEPFDVSALTVTDVETGGDYARYVFTDGYLHLAVVLRADGAETVLVTGSVGNWQREGVFTALAELGLLLPSVLPPPNTEPTGPAPWEPGTAYEVGDKVTYGGDTYKCLLAHTSQSAWTPPVVPALWGKVA